MLARGVVATVRANGVTLNAVSGVLTLYLMLTLVFGVLYALCNDLGSAPFFAGKPEDSVVPGDFVYFAVTTQTTVGFGDFVPGTNVGRAFASAQAVIGQMYLVTVVAVVISNLGRAPRRATVRRRLTHPRITRDVLPDVCGTSTESRTGIDGPLTNVRCVGEGGRGWRTCRAQGRSRRCVIAIANGSSERWPEPVWRAAPISRAAPA